jgi:hypothetical protein
MTGLYAGKFGYADGVKKKAAVSDDIETAGGRVPRAAPLVRGRGSTWNYNLRTSP